MQRDRVAAFVAVPLFLALSIDPQVGRAEFGFA